MQRWKHHVAQFLILYLSCNRSSAVILVPNEHTHLSTQSNHCIIISVFYETFNFGRPKAQVEFTLYCYYFKWLSLYPDLKHKECESLAILLRGTADPDTLEMRIVLRMSVCCRCYKNPNHFS